MGFGYLLVGYLIAFLLKLPASVIDMGALALLFGYFLMWWGVHRLKLFCHSFVWAEWCLLPAALLGGYRVAEDLASLFLWDLPVLQGTVASAVSWAELLVIVLLHAALLAAVRELGLELELKHIAGAAVRNTVMICLYAVLYVLYTLPLEALKGIQPYLGLSLTVLNLAWVLCNLWLFLTCTKDICAEGDEEQEPKRYRWEFLNRINDRYAKNMKDASDRNRDEVEAFLRRRREKKLQRAEEAERNHARNHKKRKKK